VEVSCEHDKETFEFHKILGNVLNTCKTGSFSTRAQFNEVRVRMLTCKDANIIMACSEVATTPETDVDRMAVFIGLSVSEYDISRT
jgi:hypothetical protein